MLRKVLGVFAIVVALSSGAFATSKSGAFVGINVGVPITTPEYKGSIKMMSSMFPDSGVGYAIGIDLGYKQMFSDALGLRYYIDYYFNQSFGSKGSVEAVIAQHLISANVDFIITTISWLDVYAGIGVGYQIYDPEYNMGNGAKGGFALPVNVGVNFNLSDHHMIDVGAKLGTIGYDYGMSGIMSGEVGFTHLYR